ncbi:MAG: four helix bundle protein [Desulfobacterales bacterium]|nr:four helix bundle protein [Desulfobacterales bacterium]
MKIERFENIEAWQLARELTRKVYLLTKKPVLAKDYGMKRQIQDAAGSSMHNIAEGFDSETNAEFIRFLRYAKRSCTEVQSELYVALDDECIMKSAKWPTVNREPDNLSSYYPCYAFYF